MTQFTEIQESIARPSNQRTKSIEGQPHRLAWMTEQEMNAMNDLRKEPGLLGSLARRGARQPRDYNEGIPSFQGGGDPYGHAKAARAGREEKLMAAGIHATQQGEGSGRPRPLTEMEKLQRDFDRYKAGESGRREAALEDYRGEKRQQLTDEFGGYKSRFKEMEDLYDVSGEREAVKGLAEETKDLGAGYATQMRDLQEEMAGMRGYESDVAGLRGDVAGLRAGQAGIGTQVGQLAGEAMDRDALMKDRGFYAGLQETQRKAGQRGAEEELLRGAAGSGMDPGRLAEAQARLKQDYASQAAGGALTSAAAAQQARQTQLGQSAGLYGQQASLGMRQAELAGQQAELSGRAQGLGGQRVGQTAGLYGEALRGQQGAIGMRGGFQGQSAGLLGRQMAGKGGFLQGQIGMTESQLQDVVAQQNAAQEKELAERGLSMQHQANMMNRPRGPSSMDQLLSTAATVAPVVAAFSDRKTKKNIRSAKDKDMLSPKEIDGFLGSLYAYQYNYKDGNHGEGKQVGVMAQDLEKTQLGRQMVEETPDGKQINAAKGIGLVMASQARLNERLQSIGA